MPQLRTIAVKKVYLPSTKDQPEADRAWVDLKTTMLTGEMVGTTQGRNLKEMVLYGIVESIVDWNFTKVVKDEDGKEHQEKEDIDITTVARLEQQDFEFLADELDKIKKAEQEAIGASVESEEKKTSLDTSTPSTSPASEIQTTPTTPTQI